MTRRGLLDGDGKYPLAVTREVAGDSPFRVAELDAGEEFRVVVEIDPGAKRYLRGHGQMVYENAVHSGEVLSEQVVPGDRRVVRGVQEYAHVELVVGLDVGIVILERCQGNRPHAREDLRGT